MKTYALNSAMVTLRITCRAGGQPSKSSTGRRQRSKRPAPLLSFEQKLEEQRRKQMELEPSQVEEPAPEGFLEDSPAPSAATEVPQVEPHILEEDQVENTTAAEAARSVDVELVGDEEEEGNEATETIEEKVRREITRKAQALMEIMQAGAGVEEAIARHQADIDDTMMELLQRRMDAARHLERDNEVIQGMEMLKRRLKTELDRKQASTSMRLLDSLLAILDEDADDGPGTVGSASTGRRSGDARNVARAKLRAAFGAAPLKADVMSLAAQLASSGQTVADELLEETVDPKVFIKEVTELLERALEQQRQIETALQGLAVGAPERARVQEIYNERAVALALVEDVLTLARACMKDL